MEDVQPILSNSQKDQWNSFQSHLNGDYPTPQALQSYANDNPKTTLTPAHIPVALNDISQIKNNTDIQGMTSAYKNGNSLMYPVTSEGEHINFGKGGPSTIPRPDFNDPKSIQDYRNQLYKKYGPYVKDNADLPENVDTQIEGEKSSFGDMAKNAATKLGLKPELLYSSAMQEGMRGLIPSAKNNNQTDYSGNEKFPISGYTDFGLDRFSDMYPQLAKKGYLPKGFDQNFTKSVETPTTGDNKNPVNSANFKDIDSAMQAKAAVLKNEYDNVDQMSKKNNIPLSDKARDFFSLVAFNAGDGNAEKMIKSYSAKGYLKDDKFLEKQPDASWSGPYKNVIQRVKGAEMLKGEGYF